jgi:hypothetical protein
VDGDGDGYSPCSGDCDDTNIQTWPGSAELCDGADNNCDGFPDPGEFDLDGDGQVPCGGDCDDSDPSVYSGAAETCDGFDEDCDVLVDEDFDLDGDGFAPCIDDCDDANDAIFPGQIEVCDGLDNDCDPTTDENADGDGDGISICGGDCQDGDPSITPPATNTPPIADNGANQVLSLAAGCYLDPYGNAVCFNCAPYTIALDASASLDPDGDPLGFEWNAGVSGGASAVFVTPSAMTTDLVVTAAAPSAPGATTISYVLVQTEVYDCATSSTATVQLAIHCTGL